MKTTKHGEILEATEKEMYDLWLSLGWDELYSFPVYLEKMKQQGVKIIG
jgi:hypothetical protein